MDILELGDGFDAANGVYYEYFHEYKGVGFGAYYKYRIFGDSFVDGLFIGAGLDLIVGDFDGFMIRDNRMGSTSSRGSNLTNYLLTFSIPLSYRKRFGNIFVEGSITYHYDDGLRRSLVSDLQNYENVNPLVRPSLLPAISVGYVL